MGKRPRGRRAEESAPLQQNLEWPAPQPPPKATKGRPNSERRQRLLEAIEREPGIGASGLERATGIPSATIRHHLRILGEEGHIVEHRDGRVRYFFQSHEQSEFERKALALLRDPKLNLLYRQLRKRARSPPEVALDAFVSWGWSRSSTYHRLARLKSAGLVTELPGQEKLAALALPSKTDAETRRKESGQNGQVGLGDP